MCVGCERHIRVVHTSRFCISTCSGLLWDDRQISPAFTAQIHSHRSVGNERRVGATMCESHLKTQNSDTNITVCVVFCFLLRGGTVRIYVCVQSHANVKAEFQRTFKDLIWVFLHVFFWFVFLWLFWVKLYHIGGPPQWMTSHQVSADCTRPLHRFMVMTLTQKLIISILALSMGTPVYCGTSNKNKLIGNSEHPLFTM